MAIYGLITLPSTLVSKYAPIAPPIMPGTINPKTIRLSIFPSFQWEKPEMAVVNTSAVCTLALAMAGGTPTPNKKLLDETP